MDYERGNLADEDASCQQALNRDTVQLIAEWCKWVTGIATGAIGIIGGLTKTKPPPPETLRHLAAIAAIFFVIAILFAAWALVSLPEAVQDVEGHESVWDRQATLLILLKAPLWLVVTFQSLAFVVGITILGYSIVISAW